VGFFPLPLFHVEIGSLDRSSFSPPPLSFPSPKFFPASSHPTYLECRKELLSFPPPPFSFFSTFLPPLAQGGGESGRIATFYPSLLYFSRSVDVDHGLSPPPPLPSSSHTFPPFFGTKAGQLALRLQQLEAVPPFHPSRYLL